MIEAALKLAANAIDLEEKLKDPRFKQTYERLMQAVASADDGKADGRSHLAKNQVPSFARTQRHSDAEIEAIIQQTMKGLKDEREAFLSAAHSRLSADPVLRRHFLKTLKEVDGVRYLPALDPASTWSRPG